MKFTCWFVLFFQLSFAFFTVPRVHAVLPVIAAAVVIEKTAVGAALAAAALGSFYLANNPNAPEYIAAVAGAAASAADRMYQKGFLAYGPVDMITDESFPAMVETMIAKQAAFGVSIGDIFRAVSENPSEFPDLSEMFSSHSTPSYDTTDPLVIGDIISVDGVLRKITSYDNQTIQNTVWDYYFPQYIVVAPGLYYASNGYMYAVISRTSSNTTCHRWMTQLVYTGETRTPPFTNVPIWNDVKDVLSNPPSSVAAEVDKVIEDNKGPPFVIPASSVPPSVDQASPPPTLTAADIQNAINANTAAVAKAAADAAATAAATNPNDPVAQIAAQQAALAAQQAAAIAAGSAANAQEQAQAEPEQEEIPETFPPITASPFSEAYDPGPYDIPERFSSFLNTVKSSGLFSFSSSFFNSLPGGGSPVYQIEAGQYGSHTIDLSQTMSVGLAVLKTILLACFGFLSIRAVIMKR